MEEYGVVTKPDTVRLERVLPGPIERVWEYLTESEKRRKWFAGGEMELRVGGRAELRFKHSELSAEREYPEKYKKYESGMSFEVQITRCDPPRVLAYTWPAESGDGSEVIFELSPRGKDVLLVLTHHRIASRKDMQGFAGGWHSHLGILEDNLRGEEPRPFWTWHTKVVAEYAKRIPVDEAEKTAAR